MRFRSPRSWGRGLSARAEAGWLRLRRALPGGAAPAHPMPPGFPSCAALVAAAAAPLRRADELASAESPRSGLAEHPAFRVLRGATGDAAPPGVEARFAEFEEHLARRKPRPRVLVLRDAAVMGSGHLVACQGALVRESTYLLSDLPRRVADSLARPPLDLTDDGTTWILAANASRHNYWHWMGQVLPAVLQAVEALREQGVARMGLVTAPLLGFQRELLRMLGLDALPRVELPLSQACLCGRLAYGDALAGGGVLFVPSAHRRALREALLAASAGARPLGERLYVSRADTPLRPLANAAEVEARLAREGFTVLTPGALSLPEQAMAFHGARLVVGPHGAGLGNILFCQPGAAVLELTAAGQGNAAPASLGRTSGATVCLDVFPDDPRAPGRWAVDVDRMMASLGRLA